MRTWTHWLLGAWAALVLVTASGAALDEHRDQGTDVASATRKGPAPSSWDGEEPTPPVSDAPAARRPTPPVAVEARGVAVDAPLVPVGKTPDGALAVPEFGSAGWYRHSVLPGEAGASVLAGHVDSHTGPDVFYGLDGLRPGDEVLVHHADATTSRFVVHAREVTDKDALPVERVFDAPARAELRLITCGGAFDRRSGSYESNVIVYAHLVESNLVTASLVDGRAVLTAT